MSNILVSGLINVETTVNVGSFPIQYNPINYSFFGIESAVSGVGFNVATALTVLGDNVTLTSLTGNDDSAELIKTAVNKNCVKNLLVDNSLKGTPVSVVLYDSEGKREIYCDLKDIQEKQYSEAQFGNGLNNIDLAVMCNINYNRALLNLVKQRNIKIATDVHVLADIYDSYNSDFMKKSDILFLSDEAIAKPADEFVKEIADVYNNEIIVVGLGSKGAMLYTRDSKKIEIVKSVKTRKIVNTCGAGDSLFSAFVHFYAKGDCPKTALEKAVYFASYKIGESGGARGFVTENKLLQLVKDAQNTNAN